MIITTANFRLNKVTKSIKLFIFITTLVLINGCTIPLISEMQSARTMERKALEVAPVFQFAESQQQIGIQVRTGVGYTTDIHLKTEFGSVNNNFSFNGGSRNYSTDYGFFTFGIKHGIIENYLAINFPVGLYVERDYIAAGVGPGFIGTIPVIKNQIELSLAAKYNIAMTNNGGEGLHFFTGHTNLALSSDLQKWALRFEASYLQGGKLYGGLSYSYVFGFNKSGNKREIK